MSAAGEEEGVKAKRYVRVSRLLEDYGQNSGFHLLYLLCACDFLFLCVISSAFNNALFILLLLHSYIGAFRNVGGVSNSLRS